MKMQAALAAVTIGLLICQNPEVLANTTEIAPETAPLAVEDGVLDKNFYLLRILDSPSVTAALQRDPILRRFTESYRTRLSQAIEKCAGSASCYINAARLTEAEIAETDSALEDLFDKDQSLQTTVSRLRKSGIMIRFQQDSDKQLLGEAWRSVAASVNRILSIYGDGVAPRAGAIDAMSFDPHSEEFGAVVKTVISVVLTADPQPHFFCSDPIELAGLVLKANGRDEAGRFEPMERGENKLPYEQVSHVTWSHYPYSVILVPGIAPSTLGVSLSGESRLHLDLAVTRFRHGAAPFILVSGGYVHPAGTLFSEAIEMRRELIENYHIPATAILIDPHARHTTTNLRNAGRLIYRYRMPFSKPVLIVTDEFQADMIMDPAFDERNLRETGTLPYLDKRRISPLELEVVPSVDSLQINGDDPLDP